MYQLVSMGINRYQWVSLGINRYQWVSMCFNKYQWVSHISVGVNGYIIIIKRQKYLLFKELLNFERYINILPEKNNVDSYLQI